MARRSRMKHKRLAWMSLRKISYAYASLNHKSASRASPSLPHILDLTELRQYRQATDLAGVDATLDSLASFMLHSFALQGDPAGAPNHDASLTGIPAILLCGAPGSGRTSIAKEIVRRMSIDDRVFARMCASQYSRIMVIGA
jgi:Cdc6-like AAA superfamily ATPase